MKDYQKRMVAEFKELGEKRAKLEAFTESEEFKKLPFPEMKDMQYQLAVMKEYEKALFARLQRAGMNFDAFKYEKDDAAPQSAERKPEADCPPQQGGESAPSPKGVEGFVDLGLPSGTLWAEENAEGFFTFDDAVAEFGDSLPSARHMAELYECCQWTWDNERKGCEVTGPNGNTIFLPAAGYRSRNSEEVSGVGSEGNYWTRCPDKYSAAYGRYLGFYSGDVSPLDDYDRAYGFPVRAVRESN